MPRFHPTLAGLASALVACGTSTTPLGPTLEGDSHPFVVSALRFPESTGEASEFDLDVDERPSDGADNNLGLMLASTIGILPGLVSLRSA